MSGQEQSALVSRVWCSFLSTYFLKTITPIKNENGYKQEIGVLAALINITMTHALGKVVLFIHYPG